MAKFFYSALLIVWTIASLSHGSAVARSEVESKQSRIDNLELEVRSLRRQVDRLNKEFNFKPDDVEDEGFRLRK